MTKTIEFDDIRVGDKIRATRISTPRVDSEDKCTNIYEFTVTSVGRSVVESDLYYFSKTNISAEGHRTTFELLERAPRVFKVGDSVDVLDFELLPQGTILVDKDEAIGTPRFVDAGRKKIIIDSTDMFPFSFYLESRNVGYNFVVAYTPGGEK